MTVSEAVPLVTAAIGAITFLVGGLDWLIRKWLQKHRDELITTLNQQVSGLTVSVAAVTAERDLAQTDATARTNERDKTLADCGASQAKVKELETTVAVQDEQLAELQGVRVELEKTQKVHDARVKRALKLEGAIWTQPTMADTRPFRPLAERRAPIVSVLNLKGGVGKTTLTAYLAWALSARGYRVLLVDLDLQGSLSSLFLRNEELVKLANAGQLLQHYLARVANKDEEKGPARLLDFAVPVPQLNKHCRLVAASDKLAYQELSETVRWLLRVGGTKAWSGRQDGRMVLRRALHAKGLSKKFDVVLLDCPPLINLCCSNALAASDYVLTPVTPSLKAIERVPPLLRRIQEIQHNGVNPHLKPLGVVVNRTETKSLTPNEQLLLMNLPGDCLKVYGGPVDQFDTVVSQRVAVRDAEDYFEAPDDKHPLRVTFETLAEEFVSRIPHMRRLRDDCKAHDEARTAGGAL